LVRDRFFDKYVSGNRKGAGLGTYIAKLVVELHGGGISMRTSARDGTIVAISLPLA
ncbi:MAG: ATP-binding protein, partial [Oceanidesulfovibrio sp.]